MMVYVIGYIVMTLLSIALVGVYYRFFNKRPRMKYSDANMLFFISWIPFIHIVSVLAVLLAFIVHFYVFTRNLVIGE